MLLRELAVDTPNSSANFLTAERLRELLRRSLQLRSLPTDLLSVLQQQPETAADLLAENFEVCERTDEGERIVELATGLGRAGLEQLERCLFKGTPEEAVRSVGLLARLAPEVLHLHLVPRLIRWEHQRQDAAVKAIAFSGGRERVRLLQTLSEHVHPYVLPLVLDEIGATSEAHAAPWLVRLAAGEALQAADLYIRVKAIEALGRIGSPIALPLLARLVESRRFWRWVNPREVRLCALQALARIDPLRFKNLKATAGLSERELALRPLDPQPSIRRVRQRRYPRVQLAKPLAVKFTWLHGSLQFQAEILSLSGGFARLLAVPEETRGRKQKIPRGTTAALEFHSLFRRLRATAVVRHLSADGIGFELVALDLDARSFLRELLAAGSPQPS